jgi:hypothetical protein
LSAPSIPSDVITANAERIASVLDRHLSPKRLSGRAWTEVMGAVLNARRTGNVNSLGADLDAIAAGIEAPARRAYTLCRLLLEAGWMVPPASRSEDRLASLLRVWFLRCRAEHGDLFASLRDEFIAYQRSSLPVVRRLVGDALVDEPVERCELPLLYTDQPLHDVCLRISSRILRASQKDYFKDLFDYYVRVITQAERSPLDQASDTSVNQLTMLLKNYRTPDVLAYLWPAYLKHHRNPAVAGRLMKLLREYGDPLVGNLVVSFRDSPTASSRVLAHMALHKRNARAVDAMVNLLVETRGTATDLPEFFIQSARGIFAQDVTPDSASIHRGFREALDRFDDTGDPVLRVLADSLRRVIGTVGLTPEHVEKYLRGELDEDAAYSIRYGGATVMDVLVAAAKTSDRPSNQRRLAVEMLGKLRNRQLADQIPEVVWHVYRNDTEPTVRAAALRVMGTRRRLLSDADRAHILQDSKTATGQLLAAIEDHWDVWFPPAIPEVKRKQEADAL